MTHEERIEALRGLVLSSVWREIVQPHYQTRLNAELQALIDSWEETHRGAIQVFREALFPAATPPSSAVRRGRIKALQSLLSWPTDEVQQYEIDKQRRKTQNEEYERLMHYATWGRNSPVAPPDYPVDEGEI